LFESRIGTFYDGLKRLGYDHLPTLLKEDSLSTFRKDLGDLGVAPRHIDRVVIRIENHRSLQSQVQAGVITSVSTMEATGDNNGCKDFGKVKDTLYGFTDSGTKYDKGTALKKPKCSLDADDTHKVAFVGSGSHTLIDYTYKYACLTCGHKFKIKRLKAECHKNRAKYCGPLNKSKRGVS